MSEREVDRELQFGNRIHPRASIREAPHGFLRTHISIGPDLERLGRGTTGPTRRVPWARAPAVRTACGPVH